MTKAELELATERVVHILRELRGPDDAYDVLTVSLQLVAVMSEPSRDMAVARLTNVLRQARSEMAANYQLYVDGIKRAEERQAQWQKLNRTFAESLAQWFEAEPDKPGDKTKH